MIAFAQIAQLPLDQRVVLLQQPELARRHVTLHAPQRVLETRPRDDQIADQPHQVVQPGEVDANEVRRRARRRLPTRAGSTASRASAVARVAAGGTVQARGLVRDAIGAPRRETGLVVGLHLELEGDAAARQHLRRDRENLPDLQQPRANRVDLDAALDQLRRRHEPHLPHARSLRLADSADGGATWRSALHRAPCARSAAIAVFAGRQRDVPRAERR